MAVPSAISLETDGVKMLTLTIRNSSPTKNGLTRFSNRISEIKLDSCTDGTFLCIDSSATFLCISKPDSIVIMDLNTKKIIQEIYVSHFESATFSSKSTFLTVWKHPSKPISEDKNFIIYKVPDPGSITEQKTANIAACLNAPSYSLSSRLHWSIDESLCMLTLQGQLKFFENSSFENPKIFSFKSLGDASKSSTPYRGYHLVIASFINKNPAPSFLKLFKYPRLDVQDSIASRSFFDFEEIRFEWNSDGSSVLALASKETNKGMKSYYGEQALFLLSYNGESFQIDTKEDNVIHDICWSFRDNCFAVLHGISPSNCSIYKSNGDYLKHLSSGQFNKVLYNPFGTALCLYGMGNLSGRLEFWNMNTFNQVSISEVPHATGVKWLANGTHVMFQTTSPQLRVDNGFRVVSYEGDVVCTYKLGSSNGVQHESVQLEIIPSKETYPNPTIISPAKPRNLVPKASVYVPKITKNTYFSNAKSTKT